MKWADCEAAWKRQEAAVPTAAQLAALEAGFETMRRQRAHERFVRAVVEAGTPLVVCIGIAAAYWIRGRGGWPTLVAILLILLGLAASWFAYARSRRSRPGADAPLLVKLDADIEDLRRERGRLLTLRTWYYGPVYAAALLVPFVLVLRMHAGDATWFAVDFAVYYAAVSLLVSLHNRRHVRRRLDPDLAELETLRRGLTADPQ